VNVLKFKINKELEEIIPKLSPNDFTALKDSIVNNGQLEKIKVMPDGTIIDGHHRYNILSNLGKQIDYEILENIDTLDKALNYAFEANFSRRHMTTPEKIVFAYHNVAPALEKQAKQNQGEKNVSDSKKPIRTRETIAKRLNCSSGLIAYAFNIIEKAPKELYDLWFKEELATTELYFLMKSLEDVPEEKKADLINIVVNKPESVSKVKEIIGTSNAIKALLDGETDEVRKKAEDEFEDVLYTASVDLKSIKWKLEDLAGDSHTLSKGVKKANEIGETFEEANAWFQKYGGRCLKQVTCWEGEWDKQKEKESSKEEDT